MKVEDTLQGLKQVLRVEVGSGVHGLAIEGTDDRDEMSIIIEPRNAVFGLEEWHSTVIRDAAKGERSKPGDLDLTVYGLRKYMRLICKGNPNVLIPLYAPETIVETELGYVLRKYKHRLVSQRCGQAFIGYLINQRDAALKGKGYHRGNREGRSAKWASHMLRLAYQGIELFETGNMTLPMPDKEREAVLAVKRGDMSVAKAIDFVEPLLSTLQQLVAYKKTPLLEQPDTCMINDLLFSVYLNEYAGHSPHRYPAN
jgi:predicted nucleotidyltransferase